MASPSAAMETDGDDSVIEVEMPPSTKEVIEIDLTDSPMPKVKKKTVIIGGERAPQSGTPKSKASASAAVATNTTPISATATAATNTSPQDGNEGHSVLMAMTTNFLAKCKEQEKAIYGGKKVQQSISHELSKAKADLESVKEGNEGCSVCFDSHHDIRYESQNCHRTGF